MTTDVKKYKKLSLTSLAMSAPLLLVSGFCHAQQPAINAEVLTAYQAKLAQGRQMKTALDGQAECLQRIDGELVNQRDEDQKKLGGLREQEHKMEIDISILQSKYKLFGENMKEAQAALTKNRLMLQKTEDEISNRLSNKTECGSGGLLNVFVPVVCAGSAALDEITGEAARLRSNLIESERRVKQGEAALNDLNAQVRDAGNALFSVRAEKSQVSAGIGNLEKDISSVDRSLSSIRQQSQNNGQLIDLLQGMLQEAESVSTDDGRARTARAAVGIAQHLDEALSRSQTLITTTKTSLPREMAERCSAN